MIPFLAPLLLRFPLLGKLPWKWIGAVAVVLLSWWQVRSYADRVADRRETEVRAEYKAAEEKATAQHNDRIAEVEDTYDARIKALQAERDAALARPATRTIRVPVSAVCPPSSTEDAGVPVADSADRLLEIDDPGYGQFRQWLIQYAGGSVDGG